MIIEIKKLLGMKSKNTQIDLNEKQDHTNIKNILEHQDNINNSIQSNITQENFNSDNNMYLANKMHLDFQMNKISTENKNLKMQKIVLIVCLLCAIGGMTYLGGQAKKESIITMVNDSGQTIKPINLREMKDVQQRDKIIHKIIEESLLNFRTVTPDKNLQYELAKKSLVNVKKGSGAYKLILDYYKEDNPQSPYVTGQKFTITPVIKSTINQDVTLGNEDKVKRASLLIEWRERINNLEGSYLQTNEYKANIIFDIIPPQTDEEVQKNPFGIQIYQMQIVPVRIVDKANDQVPMQ
jgi:type IV secretion system protein TrbF